MRDDGYSSDFLMEPEYSIDQRHLEQMAQDWEDERDNLHDLENQEYNEYMEEKLRREILEQEELDELARQDEEEYIITPMERKRRSNNG